ncbi:hypothetical protein BTJ48_05389 [Bacillus mycoides]|nr:hypothetical protein BTJ48_05389 [Bacillus mycoides]
MVRLQISRYLHRKTLIVLIHVNYRQEKDAKTYEHAAVIAP